VGDIPLDKNAHKGLGYRNLGTATKVVATKRIENT
jgi:hypothetical protein